VPGLNRPPLEETPAGLALFETARAIAGRIGYALPKQHRGGGSDGNFTAALAPTLDGLGVDGRGGHTHYEQIRVSSIAPRSRLFYRLFARFGELALPEGAGDFRLLDRKAVEALRALGERARFSKGLYAWIGFKSVGVPFVVEERRHGTSKWSFRKLLRFALDGVTSFSTVPLRVWTYIGGLVSLLALGTAFFFLVRTLIYGPDVPGYASLIVSVMFFSGIQLMSLGILGEYIGRIFAEVKRRPLYVVADRVGAAADVSRAPVRDERRTALKV